MHLMRVIDGKMLQVHLCATCAAEFGLKPPDETGVEPGDLVDALKKLEELGRKLTRERDAGEPSGPEGGELGPADVLEALGKGLGRGGDGPDSRAEAPDDADDVDGRCPACGMAVRKMIRTHSSRCPACYDVLAKHIHWTGPGTVIRPYAGRVPASADAAVRYAVAASRLEGRLRAARCAERYEEAAAIRDELMALMANPSEGEGLFWTPPPAAAAAPRQAPADLPHEAGLLRVALSLGRNLADEPFFSKSQKEGRRQVASRVEEALHGPDLSLPPGVRAAVGRESHVLIDAEGPVADADALLAAVLEADSRLEAAGLRWAFEPRLGYLAGPLVRCGTGLDVRILLHLPALHALGRIPPANRVLAELGLALVPMADFGGGRSPLPCYWLRVPPRLLLERICPLHCGRDEAAVLADSLAVARALARQDYEAMQRLDLCWAEDRFLRAAASLALARRLGRVEAMALLSDVRMGAELGLDPAPVPLDARAFLPPSRFHAALRAMDLSALAKAAGAPPPPDEADAKELLRRARAAYFDRFFPDGRRPAAGNPGAAADDSSMAGADEPPPAPKKPPRRGRPPRRKPKGPAE